jgi:hypothetical protein
MFARAHRPLATQPPLVLHNVMPQLMREHGQQHESPKSARRPHNDPRRGDIRAESRQTMPLDIGQRIP